MKKTVVLLSAALIFLIIITAAGCNDTPSDTGADTSAADAETAEPEINRVCELLAYKDALAIFTEETEAEILDIETGISFKIRRVTGGYNTLADVETLSIEETNKLLETTGGKWDAQKRRAVIVTVGDRKIAASISPFQHSGSEDFPYGDIIDNRSGATGTGINLDGIRGNGMVGVVDIFFFNSLTPGVNRVDPSHQDMVMKAYDYEG